MHRFTFFVAHASPDAQWAEDLYNALQPEPTALDERTVGPGTPWQARLVEAQSASRATVVLLSRRAPNAWYFQDEIGRAIELMRRESHRVFPVWIDGLPRDQKEVPYGLYPLQALDGEKLGPQGVADILRAELGEVPDTPIGPPPEPPSPATGEQLLDAAIRILPPRLDTIAQIRLSAPVHEFRTGTQANYATDLIMWANTQSAATRGKLEALLREAAPVAFEGP